MSKNREINGENGRERRFSGGKVELREDAAGKRIVGTGILYYDGTPATEFVLWDDRYGRAVERVMPGAAKAAVARDDIRGLFNHDPNLVLGRNKAGTMAVSETTKGVDYDIKAGDTTAARDVVAHLERGDVSGSSFSFTIPVGGQKWTIIESADGRMNEIREISDMEIYDMGPVTFPAYENTTAGLREARQAERGERSVVFVGNDKRVRLAEIETECAT